MTNSAQTEQSRLLHLFLISSVAAVGGFLFGYDLSIISGAQQYLKQQFALDDKAFGLANSSACSDVWPGLFSAPGSVTAAAVSGH